MAMNEIKKPRINHIYELIGRINRKKIRKPSEKAKLEAQAKGKKLNEYFYQMIITCENNPKVENLYIFKDSLETEKIWKDIENSEYIDKRFMFFCHNNRGNYRLINWKELTNHGSN